MFRLVHWYVFDIKFPLSEKHNLPIYTLPTLTGRTYIITSPLLAAQIQRTSKSTSFYSAILEVTRRLCAFDNASMDVIMENVNRDHGDHGLMPETHDMLNDVLGPGPILNGITQFQLEKFNETLGKLNVSEHGEEIDLLGWVKEQFILSNARAIYGSKNIFDVHPELIEDFWIFEQGMLGLVADVLPAITTRKAHAARKRLLTALREYVHNGHYKNASPVIQKRVAINLKNGITEDFAGNAEIIMLFAIVGNAVPTTFWLLANLFADPELLQEVRAEVVKATEVTGAQDGIETRTIHVDMLKTVAPVLTSSFRETLRMVANLTSVRWILEDTIIGDSYLLKKDSIVQVASGVIHMDEETWGADAEMFNAKRFITTTTDTSNTSIRTAAPLPKNVPSAAFRAFGGGSVICPGRHFAQSEIVGFVAAVVMAFDIQSPGSGGLKLPKRCNTAIPLAVMKPMERCGCIIKRRPDMAKWVLAL